MPFSEDHRDRPWDREAVQRFHRASTAFDQGFAAFRTSFLGKSSPVHLFWGAIDLAVRGFSGRRAPLHRGGIPALPDDVVREAYDREVSSASFWPGSGGIDYPALYAYACTAPSGFRNASVRPDAAFWHEELGEFILPYDAVRSAADPDDALMAFLVSTYEAAADRGGWDRDLLECVFGRPRRIRPPDAEQSDQAPRATDVPVEQEEGTTKGRYRIVGEGMAAKMTYTLSREKPIIIDDTDVPAALRGRRIGEQMVRRAVEDARRDGVTIIPLCPFAKVQIERHSEWQDMQRRA